MKIGLAQINLTVGDFQLNAKKLVRAYREALDAGVDLVVGPKGGLVGYPVADLVYKARFVAQSQAVLEEIAKEVGDIPFCLGYIASKKDEAFTSSVVILHKGLVVESCLNEDDGCFFSSAQRSFIWNYKGMKIGFFLGSHGSFSFHKTEAFVREVASEFKDVHILINLQAFAFQLGAQEQPLSIMKFFVESLKIPVVYCSSVGGNDEIIFNGGSLAVSRNGEVLARGREFEEDVVIVDLEGEKVDSNQLGEMESLYKALALGVRDYVQKSGFGSVVIGLDGGIDSAVSAVLAQEALGSDAVQAYTITDEAVCKSVQRELSVLAENLEIGCNEIPFLGSLSEMESAISLHCEERVMDLIMPKVNARVRGAYLLAMAESSGALLLSTVNKTDLALGRCTIYGDTCGGLAIGGGVSKALMYKLAHWINREKEIIPGALIKEEIKGRRRESLADCEKLEKVLELYTEQNKSSDEIIAMFSSDFFFEQDWQLGFLVGSLRVAGLG